MSFIRFTDDAHAALRQAEVLSASQWRDGTSEALTLQHLRDGMSRATESLPSMPPVHLPLTTAAKKALERSRTIALDSGHEQITLNDLAQAISDVERDGGVG